jgi:death-on-curing protein
MRVEILRVKKAMRPKKKVFSSTNFQIVGHKKLASGAELWRVRTSDGRVVTLRTHASSAAIMDRVEKRFKAALERLAKR